MLTGILAGIAALAATAEPALVVSPCDFGEAYQFSTVHCTTEYTNTTDKPIHVRGTGATLPTDSIKPATATIAPKGTAYFEVEAKVEHDLGRSAHWFYVSTDDAGNAKRYTKASGFVLSVLDDPAPQIDFGVVQTGSVESTAKSVVLESHEAADFQLSSVVKSSDHFNVRIGNDHKTVTVALKSNLPWGLLDDYVVLASNAPQQHEVAVRIKADVHGDVTPSDNPFPLGLMRKGGTNEALIRLTSRSGKDFKVGKIEIDNLQATTEILPCRPMESGCKLLRLLVSDSQPSGIVAGSVNLNFPDFRAQLPIRVTGMLLNSDTKIRDLDKKKDNSEQKAAAGTQAGQSVAQPQTNQVDLKSALHRVAKAAEQVAPPGNGPLLKWAVAHEELVYGYVIYRSNAEAGPFVRANKETVLVKDADDAGSSYQWRDSAATPGQTYWYYIGLIHNDGTRQKLSGPQKVVAK